MGLHQFQTICHMQIPCATAVTSHRHGIAIRSLAWRLKLSGEFFNFICFIFANESKRYMFEGASSTVTRPKPCQDPLTSQLTKPFIKKLSCIYCWMLNIVKCQETGSITLSICCIPLAGRLLCAVVFLCHSASACVLNPATQIATLLKQLSM